MTMQCCSCFLNAESEWTNVCELVNISYARLGQTIIVRRTCKCSVSTHISTKLHNLFKFSADVIHFDCFNYTSSTSVLRGCDMEMKPYLKNMTWSDGWWDSILILPGSEQTKQKIFSADWWTDILFLWANLVCRDKRHTLQEWILKYFPTFCRLNLQ